MRCNSTPWQTHMQFLLWPSSPLTTSCCALHDGLVPAVTRMVKSHHTNPLHQVEVYKQSLSRAERVTQLLKTAGFPQCKCRSDTEAASAPVYLGLHLKAFWEVPRCLQGAFDHTTCAAVPSSENSCKNADYSLPKCYLTDFPRLCVSFNAYQMLPKHCIQHHINKNQEWSDCYIQLKSKFLEAIFICYHLYDGAITFFHFYFIFNCTCFIRTC